MALQYLGEYNKTKEYSEDALSLEKQAYNEVAEFQERELSSIYKTGVELSPETYGTWSHSSSGVVKIPVDAWVENPAPYQIAETAQATTSRITGEVGYKAITATSTAETAAGTTTTVSGGGTVTSVSLGRAIKSALTALGVTISVAASGVKDKLNSLISKIFDKDDTLQQIPQENRTLELIDPYRMALMVDTEGKTRVPKQFVKNVAEAADELELFAVSTKNKISGIAAGSTVTFTLSKISTQDIIDGIIGTEGSPFNGYTITADAMAVIDKLFDASSYTGSATVIEQKINNIVSFTFFDNPSLADGNRTVQIRPLISRGSYDGGEISITNLSGSEISWAVQGIINGDGLVADTSVSFSGSWDSSKQNAYKSPVGIGIGTMSDPYILLKVSSANKTLDISDITTVVDAGSSGISSYYLVLLGNASTNPYAVAYGGVTVSSATEESGISASGWYDTSKTADENLDNWAENTPTTTQNSTKAEDGTETEDATEWIPLSITNTGLDEDTGADEKPGADSQTGEFPDISGGTEAAIDIIEGTDPAINENIEGTSEQNQTEPVKPTTPVDSGTTKNDNVDAVVTPDSTTYNGLYIIYNPTTAEVTSLGGYLWSSTFLDTITKVVNDPMEAVINFYRIYCTPDTTTTEYNIILGNANSGVLSKVCTSRYITLNCGTISIPRVYRNTLDYTQTNITIYLPFIGFIGANIGDFMKGSINITYKIDLVSGTCLALVKAIKGSVNSIIGQYVGDASEKTPLTASNSRSMLQGMASIALGLGRTATGDLGGIGAVAGGAASMMNHPVEIAGSVQGNAGALGYKKPYVIIRRRDGYNPTTYSDIGLPSNSIATVAQTSGHVTMRNMTIIGAMTADEKREIESLFSSGVIV